MFEQSLWIWKPGERRPINEHICFRKTFQAADTQADQATLSISTDTKFRLWVNGVELGEGPIRSTADHWFYEAYDISHLIRPGVNVIAVKVWHYGHSNYQYVENEAGLIAELRLSGQAAGTVVIGTDDTWLQRRHGAYEIDTVKRNVNIGWMEIYNAGAMDEEWMLPDYDDSTWERSAAVASYGDAPWGVLHPRDIEPLSTQILRPKQVISISEIKPIQQVISVNMRENLYPESRDANAKIFSGFLAAKLVAAAPASGRLTFAHSKWNGVQGRFRIGHAWYEHNAEINIPQGEYLFLMEICGVHNDLFTHMELDFNAKLEFVHPFGKEGFSFVTIGPFETIEPYADGYKPVYGGVEKSTGLNHEHPLLKEIGTCSTIAEFEGYQDLCEDIDPRHVLVNHMIYSQMLRKKVLRSYPITNQTERMIHDHLLPTVLPSPVEEGDIETILDFGKIVVGTIEWEVDAPQGTVIDVYGFENRVNGANAYTSGCNNSFRYICREGRQTFRSGTRMGFRYLIVTVRNADVPVRIHRFQLHQSSYPATDKALFRCSDPLLNDIWEISRHTSQMCMEDTFVDCPTYEQVFWVGDCRVSALVNYHLFGSYELVRHCLEMVPRSRSQSSLLLALLPTDWQAAIPMWTFSWVIACKEYVTYSGDSAFLEKIYPEIRLTLEAYRGFLNKDGLFDTSSWNLLDWAPIDIPYVGVVTAQQAQLSQCHGIAADMAERLGMIEEAAELRRYSEQLKLALQEHLWDEQEQVYLDGIHRTGERSTTHSLQTHILLYLADCLSEHQAAVIEPKLMNPPKEWIQIGSPFFSFYLFEVWKRFGELDRTLAQIRKDWGQMIRYGATTTWETFNVFPRSHAHAWSAAPAFILGDQVLGIEMLEDGFRKIRINPPVTAELRWAEGVIPTPYGRIDIAWSTEEQKPVMRVSVPRDIEIEVGQRNGNAEWEILITAIE